jgi:hypothetical protein
MKWILHGCPVCGGDLHENLTDEGWLTCFMCAREFPASEGRGARLANRLVQRGVDQGIVKEMPYGPSLAEATRRAA